MSIDSTEDIDLGTCPTFVNQVKVFFGWLSITHCPVLFFMILIFSIYLFIDIFICLNKICRMKCRTDFYFILEKLKQNDELIFNTVVIIISKCLMSILILNELNN